MYICCKFMCSNSSVIKQSRYMTWCFILFENQETSIWISTNFLFFHVFKQMHRYAYLVNFILKQLPVYRLYLQDSIGFCVLKVLLYLCQLQYLKLALVLLMRDKHYLFQGVVIFLMLFVSRVSDLYMLYVSGVCDFFMLFVSRFHDL